jgi:hypothetical protein
MSPQSDSVVLVYNVLSMILYCRGRVIVSLAEEVSYRPHPMPTYFTPETLKVTESPSKKQMSSTCESICKFEYKYDKTPPRYGRYHRRILAHTVLTFKEHNTNSCSSIFAFRHVLPSTVSSKRHAYIINCIPIESMGAIRHACVIVAVFHT